MFVAKNAYAEVDISKVYFELGATHIDGQSLTSDSENMRTTLMPLTIKKQHRNLSFGIMLTHLKIKTNQYRHQGIGDSFLTLGYEITPALTLNIIEKMATGDETKRLSTGKNDTSVELKSMIPDLTSNYEFSAKIRYSFIGKNTLYEMQNSAAISIGSLYKFPKKTALGVQLNYQQNAFKHLDNQLGFTTSISKNINQYLHFSAFAGFDNTQTHSFGVSLNGKF